MVKWICKECGNQNGDGTACVLSFSGDQPAGAVSVPVLCPLTNELNPEWELCEGDPMDNGFVYKNGKMMVDNGCPKCEELLKEHIIGEYFTLCLDCQLEQAEATKLQAVNQVERIKQKIKEQENGKVQKETSSY